MIRTVTVSPWSLLLAGVLSGALLGGCAFGGSASATVTVQTGFFFGHDVRQERSIVYVLDLSGSMNEQSGTIVENAGTDVAAQAAGGVTGGLLGRGAGNVVEDRIKRLKQKVEKVKLHLIASLNGLPPDASFNLILFDGSVQKLSPVFLQANGLNTTLVSAFVDRLEAGGSTNIYEAMEAALADQPAHIILLTDGMPTSSTPEEILDMVRGYQSTYEFRVSTVGVGSDQARQFLSALAAENHGTYQFFN